MNKDVLDSMLYGMHASNEVRHHVTAYATELRGISESVQLETAIYEVACARALIDRLRRENDHIRRDVARIREATDDAGIHLLVTLALATELKARQ